MAKKKNSKTKKNYFTKVHENAIIQYVATEDREVKTFLYIKYIQPVFDEMVNKIVYTYKFNHLPNIEYLKDDCKVWLTTILAKYNPEKAKAFTYFTVVIKNWFIGQVKQNSKKSHKEIFIDDINSEDACKFLTTYNNYDELREKREFWESLISEIEVWQKQNLKPGERKVLAAIKILLEQSDNIEIFNKKAIYLYMREITGMNTKQIVNNLKRMRIKYKNFKKRWDLGNI